MMSQMYRAVDTERNQIWRIFNSRNMGAPYLKNSKEDEFLICVQEAKCARYMSTVAVVILSDGDNANPTSM